MKDYYKKAFENKTNILFAKWNWAAFIFGELWLVYRRMYLYGLICLLLYVAEDYFNYLFVNKMSLIIVNFLIRTLLGIYGTSIYKRHLLKKNILNSDGEISLKEGYRATTYSMPILFSIIGYGAKATFDLVLGLQTLTAPQLNIGTDEGEERLLNVGSSEVSNALKALKPGKGRFVTLALKRDNNDNKFIQTVAEFANKDEIVYVIEYRESNETPLYEFRKKKNQAETIRTFIKFLNNDASFKDNANPTIISDYYLEAQSYLKPPKKDMIKAITLLKLAAEEGCYKAQTTLGLIHLECDEIKRDVPNAIKYFEMAAKQGDVNSYNDLTYIFSKGIHVKVDMPKAFKYCEAAIEQGDLSGVAHYNLGAFYEYGEYVQKDKKKALELYRKSADLGMEKAKQKVEQLTSDIK